MKCIYCGRKLKNGATFCSKCGRKQSFDALPEGEAYGEPYEDYTDSPYTPYEEVGDVDVFDSYVPPVQKKSKLPVLVAGIAVLLLVILGAGKLISGIFGGGKEYDLIFPDLMAYMGSGNYEKVMEVSRLTHHGEDEGRKGYIYEIMIHEDQMDQFEDYLELVEDYHYKLVEERDGYYFFRFTGTNAPEVVHSKDTEYHFMLAVAEEISDYVVLRCTWLDGFERDKSVKGAAAKPEVDAQTQPRQTTPVETQPTQTTPKETKPVETKPAETQPKETQPKETVKPVSNDRLVLPDPTKFFGCAVGENQKHEETGWMVSCKFDLGTGREVVSEFLSVLQSDDYPLELTDAYQINTIGTSAQLFTYYCFDYTGISNKVVGMHYEKQGDLEETVDCDVRLAVYYNYRAGWILVSFFYDDAFVLEDPSVHASKLPVDYTKASDEVMASIDNPNWNKDVLPCTGCDGDGDCSECNDFGYLWSSASDSFDRNCWRCNNSGICQYCYGTGKR